ncbi:immunoglobulin superfamily member 1-like isoform X2 [Tachyglossus aculeatus]|uniref:immunoglobulin superfamily member 1-like isoform X2 n=1 Tax=Tachyglossus aculeatus TaxID=9261 RepID=UPI0018F40470|nr:immunoglobulin superfamily member 1-like isoform X2 [Tachyglossus aculeatus]
MLSLLYNLLCLVEISNPNIWAEFSSLSPPENMTLQCQGPLESKKFQLTKDGEVCGSVYVESPAYQASFPLGPHPGSYRCYYWLREAWYGPSSFLDITAASPLPKPRLSAKPYPLILPKENVLLWCYVWMKGLGLALYKAGEADPLQTASPKTMGETFSISSPGNYTCRSHTAGSPVTWSDHSDPVEIVIAETLPKPILSSRHRAFLSVGADLSLECAGRLNGLGIELYKDGEPVRPLEISTVLYDRVSFLIRKLDAESGGNYSCRTRSPNKPYIWSEPSDPLEFMVTGSWPRPSLSVHPMGPVTSPGTNVTFRCQASRQGVRFGLRKKGIAEAIQHQNPTGDHADFLLVDVAAYDTGNYSCVYYDPSVPYGASQISEPLEIHVNVTPTKPTLSAPFGSTLGAGRDLTLICTSRYSWARFEIYKEGRRTLRAKWREGGARNSLFVIPNVGYQDGGSYSCRYRMWQKTDPWSEFSDPLEIKVTGLGTLPAPKLTVQSGSTPDDDIIFRCSGTLPGMVFELYRRGEKVHPLGMSSLDVRRVDFRISKEESLKGGRFSCRYHTWQIPYVWSEPSDAIPAPTGLDK